MMSTIIAITSNSLSTLWTWLTWKTVLIVLFSGAFARTYYVEVNKRTRRLPKIGERVLILGASSGVGRAMARQYAARGARVCVVGRREALLLEVRDECIKVQLAIPGLEYQGIVAVTGDFTSVEDMVNIRTVVQGGVCVIYDFS